MKFTHPLEPFQVGQGFALNFNSYYASQGQKGHSGMDFNATYGQSIYAATDSFFYSTINFGNPPDKYRAVYTIVDEPDFSYEITYGHVIDSPLTTPRLVKAGELIARAGNFGNVYVNGKEVTTAEKLAGLHLGTHLHFQVRKCVRKNSITPGNHYLSDGNGRFSIRGLYYEIIDYDNGFNGCIDPAPFFNIGYAPTALAVEPYKFTKTLKFGDKGTEVTTLQKRLVERKYLVMPSNVAYGYYGELTKQAVRKLQKDNQLVEDGIFGINSSKKI